MTEIIIRNCRTEDESALKEITYRTGFQGEDLTGRGFFDDKRLWYMLFIYYYHRYEPQHCFVAVDTSNESVVGFICGTPDTAAQQARFEKIVVPRIALRAFLYTSWRHPHTFRTLMDMMRTWRDSEASETGAELWAEYPAHLHIDLLAPYQSQGLGTRLMQRFENHMIDLNVKGLHLKTTDRNRKAVPFYKKMGFTIINETKVGSHPLLGELAHLTFAKKLCA